MTAMEFVRSNIVQFSALAFLTMIAVEQIAIRLFHRRGKTPLKDSGVSIAMGFLSEPANAATAFITLGALAAVPLCRCMRGAECCGTAPGGNCSATP